MSILFLDLETFSEADLKKVGSYAYAEHPSTEILLAIYAIDDGEVHCWDCTDGSRMPDELRRALRQVQRHKAKIVGHNFLMFDRLVIKNVWGVELDPRDIIDTMICAFRHSLPGSLAALCEVLQIDEDMAKDKSGKALINRFSKPTPKNYKIRRYDRTTHQEEWKAFIKYGISDITSMREVYHSLPQWGNTEFENTVLAVDQRINDRGFYVDTALANAAIDAVKQHKIELQAEANARWGAGLTGADFLPTLRDLAPGHEIPNAQKSTLNDLLADDDLPDDARTIIEMRLGASSTASTKYNPLLLGLSADGRRRGCLQYGGAKRTLRWAGKGFQPQNLARGHFSGDELDQGIDMLLKGRAHWLYDVSKLTASTVRGCIIPTAGNKLVVADYSNVEGRGLAWAAGERTALDTFEAGLDIYCVTAGKMFGLEPDFIKKERKDLRQIGKACLHRNTQVLTDTGFKDVMVVSSTDKVWNGVKWVNTNGAKLMGWKPVISLDGVQMTEDHRILAHSWLEAKELASHKYILGHALMRGSDAWLSFVNCQKETGIDNFSDNAIAAKCRVVSRSTMCAMAEQRSVTPAQWKPQRITANNTSAMKMQCPMMNTEGVFLTDYLLQSVGATDQKTSVSKIMAGEGYQFSSYGIQTSARFLHTYKQYLAGITQNLKWVAKTTTVTTSLETFGLSAVRKTATTEEKYLNFSAATMRPLPGLLNLNGKLQYCEPVYDLINVAEGNRFLIKSASGYLLVHNCELGLGYGGGVAAFLTFAKNLGLDLYAMAETMKGTFPDHIWAAAKRGYEYARIQEKNKKGFAGQKAERPSYDLPKNVWLTCDSIKRMWRESHPATCQFWGDLESAAMNAIKDPGKAYWAGAAVRENGDRAIKLTRTFTKEKGERVPGWWLKVELPSGRVLSYPGIGISVEKQVEEEDYWYADGPGKNVTYRERIRYMGENQTTRQWGKQYTYGGKLAENITQALCRDLLAYALVNVDAAGWPIILHVHDEVVCEVPNEPEYSVAKLEALMCTLPSWAADFPLAAEGAELMRYAK
ncbi:hypothetical protein DLF23_22110 [Salmonella enterica subsp. enterica serovar Newport]|nr:hypothetical protein [Salmonella enterica subsp. enterica serovar Newport]